MSNWPTIEPNRPGWDDDPDVPAWLSRPPLVGAVHADACVVGLGASGLAAVQALADRGRSVVGVDGGRVAGAAAGRNGGFLSCGGAMGMSSADTNVSLELRSELYRETERELVRLENLLGTNAVRRRGSLSLAGLPGEPVYAKETTDIPGYLTALHAERDALASIGVRVEDYDGVLGQGFFNPDAASVNPVSRAFGLAAALPATVTLYENSPVRVVEPGAVRTRDGIVHAPVIVICIDGKLDVLLPQLASAVHTVRLQMVATAPITAGRLPCGAGWRDDYEWAQQDPAGRLLIGGGRDWFAEAENTLDDDPTDQVQDWIESAASRVAGERVRITHRWAASVGYTPDRRALCTEVDDGVVACGGYSGSGNLVGPVAARAAVALAVDRTTPPGYLRHTLD